MSDSALLPILNQILERLSALERHVGAPVGATSAGGSSSTSGGSDTIPPSVAGYDAYLSTYLAPFVAACDKLGGDAQKAGQVVKDAFEESRKIILMSTKCKEPTQAQLQDILKGLGGKMKAASVLVSRNEWEKHTKTCSEGIGCLNWIVVKPSPREFIESFIGGSDYWANNIRKEFRTTNPDQIAFCDTFKALLNNLMAYVKEFYLTGLSWNPKGVTVSEFNPSEVAAAAPAPAAKPPAAATSAAPAAASAAPKVDLFAALNKEGDITSGLKKVTKDMQTWRAEYKDAGAAPAPAAAKKPVAARSNANEVKGTPNVEFTAAGNKWNVEYQSDVQGVVEIPINDKKETVYIFGCVGATISVVGKCKSIIVDNCKKTKVYFDSVMASCEVVNCQRMQIICKEAASAVAIDKTDGIVVTLPASSLHTEIVASKSSEMNVSFPDESGEMIERPIPEQYVHRIKGKSITADVSELYTH